MKGTFIVVAFALAALPAAAQDPAPPATASQPAPPPPQGDASARRSQVRMMETVLTQAVRAGAENLAKQMQISEPGSLIVTGTARARGFVLDGYGVFFDVDVPMMKQSVVWSTQVMLREQMRSQYQTLLARLPDGPERQLVRQRLADLDRPGAGFYGVIPPPDAVAPPGRAAAQTVNESTSAPAPAAAAPTLPPVDARDPNERYTDAVKVALIDAMLDYNFIIGPEEWLTVAARDAEGPSTPGELYDVSTLVFRAKGSDLLAFRAGRLSRDEARKRVFVTEF